MTFRPIKAALDTLNVYPDGWENQSVTIEPNEPKPDEIQYERKWVALLTVPNSEAKAAIHLNKISVLTPTVVYWPRYMVQVRVGEIVNGRKQRAPRPRSVFVGMMFASIAVGNYADYRPFRDFEATPWLRGYLRNGQGFPRYLSDREMDEVRDLEVRVNAKEAPAPVRKFVIGEHVKIVSDLVKAWPCGKICHIARDGRLDVEIAGLLGRVTVVRGVLPQDVEIP